MIKITQPKEKLRDIAIFKNKTNLNPEGTVMLHQDDMPSYASWFLTTYHFVDKVIYRGLTSKAPSNIEGLQEALERIGNPHSIIVTFSEKDTY